MLVLAGLLCLAAAVGVHHWNLHRGVYHRVPYEILALVVAAALAGYFSLEGGGLLAVVSFAVEALVLSAALLYLLFASHFPRRRLSLSIGDRLPEFALPDSEGGRFDSSSLIGKKAALYLFYRGDW